MTPLKAVLPMATLAVAVAAAGVGGCTAVEDDAGIAAGESPGVAAPSTAPQSAAEELLARSIAFHDPEGSWGRKTIRLSWNGTGTEGEERSVFDVRIFPDGRTFEMSGRYRGSRIEYATDGETVTTMVDGSADIDAEARENLRLSRDGGMFWRDYFTYLAGLPMKLRDPGTILDSEPIRTEFMGREVESIRVTYDPEVGGDTWYFYFDAESAELVGCRFYHDEAANDGEYIVLEELIESDGLLLPKKRRWYMNIDGSFLGEDVIEMLALGS